MLRGRSGPTLCPFAAAAGAQRPVSATPTNSDNANGTVRTRRTKGSKLDADAGSNVGADRQLAALIADRKGVESAAEIRATCPNRSLIAAWAHRSNQPASEAR